MCQAKRFKREGVELTFEAAIVHTECGRPDHYFSSVTWLKNYLRGLGMEVGEGHGDYQYPAPAHILFSDGSHMGYVRITVYATGGHGEFSGDFDYGNPTGIDFMPRPNVIRPTRKDHNVDATTVV